MTQEEFNSLMTDWLSENGGTYNSAYTGPQIDSAIGAVSNKADKVSPVTICENVEVEITSPVEHIFPYLFVPILGNVYKVLWDGVEYICTGNLLLDSYPAIGDVNYQDFPFIIVYMGEYELTAVAAAEIGTYNVSIYDFGKPFNQLAAIDEAGNLAISGKQSGDFATKKEAEAAIIAAVGAEATARAAADNALQTAIDGKSDGGASYVYTCTGTADSTTIANIINDFFNNGTAKSMKLVVTGTMGIEFHSSQYAIYIDANNTRGAVCYIDFSDCHIPDINIIGQNFLYVGSGANLQINGLVVKSRTNIVHIAPSYVSKFCISNSSLTGYGESAGNGILVAGNGEIYISNCKITSSTGVRVNGGANVIINKCNMAYVSGATSSGVMIAGSGNVIIDACTILENFNGINLNAANSGNHIISNCVIINNINGTGNSNAVTVGSSYAGNLIISNCFLSSHSPNNTGNGISMSSGRLNVSNCVIDAAGAVNSYGISVGAMGGSCDVIIENCKISSGTYGIYIQKSNTASIIRLIGSRVITDIGNYDVFQSSAASTISWHISGCTFSKSEIYVDGAAKSPSIETKNEKCYMPAYANFFSRTIT